MSRHLRLKYYLLFACGFTGFWFLFKLGGIPDLRLALLSTGLDILFILAVLIATVEGIVPRFYYRRLFGRFTLALVALIFTAGSANILGQLALHHMPLFTYQAQLAKYKEHFFYWFWSDLVAGSYFMLAVIALGGFAIRLAFDRLQGQLEALKGQTNPHFILNALNTIYYSIDATNRSARDLTERFASLLRYQLYECDHPAVPIEKETASIADYVLLQQQRTGDAVTIRHEGLDGLTGFSIPPYLLMPLVENCFKHISHFPDRPNYIELSAVRENGIFRFTTCNSFDPAQSSDNPGIGLALTRKRLSLLGKNSALLETGAGPDSYLTTLTLRLP